jgi:phosphoribosylformylglycinamidine cyclo-ligase
MPSVMRLFGALGGIEEDELRATFNGGLGMVVIVAREAVATTLGTLANDGVEAAVVGEVAALDELGRRYVEEPLRGVPAG